jgi:hypothetical protein
MKCANCGAEVAAGVEYCASCGASATVRLCPNGHVMDPSWSECIYCQSSGVAAASQAAPTSAKGKTLIEGVGAATAGQAGGLVKGATLLEGSGSVGRTAPQPPALARSSGGSKKKTLFDPGIGSAPSEAAPAVRTSDGHLPRLAGWLVSFSHDRSGVDYRLREGRNTVGADSSECEIAIAEDPSISSKHAVIMIRGGKCQIRDNDSTNGTFVNGSDIFGESSKILNDGDQITFGSTDCLLVMLPRGNE